jgi:uroporphyrinogen decarboxylase
MTLSLYGARLTGCPLEEYYRNAACYDEGQAAVRALCQPDILFAPFALSIEAAAFGCELQVFADYPPNIRRPAVRSPEAFAALELPDIDSHPRLLYLREAVRLMTARWNKEVPVCAVLTTPVDLPALVMGIDGWIDTLITRPDLARTVLDHSTRHFVGLANALLAEGAAFVALPMIFTNPRFLYQKLVDDLILPVIREAFAQVRGPIVIHHGGNPLLPTVQAFLDLPQVAAYAFDHRDALAEARSILGPSRLMLGGINGPTLGYGPLETTLARVKAVLDDRRHDPAFIFASAGADVPYAVEPARIAAIARAVQTWGPDS